VDDARGFRVLRWLVGLVLLAGVAGCVSESADQPADPVVADDLTTTTTPTSAPGSTDSSAPATTGAPGGSLASRFGAVAARLVDLGGEVVELCLLQADTPEERAQGLMGVTDLEGHDGMLFSVEQPVDGAFYMYRTVLPLTIGWWDADGAFLSRADMAPCASDDPDACERYPSGGAWRWAIEVEQGAPLAERFQPGATLTVTGGACAARTS